MKKLSRLSLSLATLFLTGCTLQAHDQMAWCEPEKPVQPSAQQPEQLPVEQVNLSADALFAFGKSDSSSLLNNGKQTLDELALKLNGIYLNIEKINVIGHTDRLGSEQYNYQLGLERANSVKSYLESKGVKAPITVASAGESQPVTQCVGEKSSPALTACLQPDRRVVVEIQGTKKTAK